jgi:hypothetical protein
MRISFLISAFLITATLAACDEHGFGVGKPNPEGWGGFGGKDECGFYGSCEKSGKASRCEFYGTCED